MCSICGYIQKNKITNNSTIISMKNSIIQKENLDNDIYVHENVAFNSSDAFNIKGNNYIISYNGEIYNANVLKNILTTRGYEFKTGNESEVLVLLYVEFKEKMLKYINGAFSFAIYDENNNRLFLAKDRLGIKPLFYTQIDNTLVFSSEIKGILASKIIKPVVTKQELLELFSLGPAHSPGKTYFKGIYELPAGHYAVYKDNTLDIIKYWDLCEKKMIDSDDEIINNVKYLVTDATKKQLLSSNNNVSSMLSGGLDSSILTKLATDNITSLNTYSINYENNDKDFVANSYQQTKDSDFVKIMTKYLNTNHKDIIVTDTDLFNNLYEAVIARDMPGMADIDSSMLAFCRQIANNDEKIILSGECSDEIFGGYPWFYKEHLKNTDGFPWALSENLREHLIKKEIFNDGDITNYIKKTKKNTLKNISHVSLDKFENEFKDINYLTIKFFMNTLIERTDRMSRRTTLKVRVPYADYRIFEYVYNVDAKLKLGMRKNGNEICEKYILKQAFKEDIPSDITKRKKSPFPKTYSKTYLDMLERKIIEIIGNPESRIHEIINTDYVLNLIKTHGKDLTENLFGQLMTYPQTLAFIIQIDYWLTTYNIKLEI